MSDETFTGLRPIVRRQIGNDLNRQTKRIVLPPSSSAATFIPPPVEADPVPVAVPVPVPVAVAKPVAVKPRFSLVPGAPALREALPHGVVLTPGWLFIGSNPSLETVAFTSLVLHFDGISKLHAAITEFHDKPFVTDMGSTNGTRIFRNPETIQVGEEPIELHPGDILSIGLAFFQVVQS